MNKWQMTVAALLLAAWGGCNLDPRTTNQGGGSLLSAGGKAASGDLAALNADEWQILFDNAPSLASQFNVDLGGITIPVLTDDQAQSLVNCVSQAGIHSLDALQNLDNLNISACTSLASLF